MTLSWLIYTAYGEGMSTSIGLTGGPEWRNQTAYAIEAQSHEPATQQQLRAMLRTLLEDRFALMLHTETSEGDVYALVVDPPDGKLGPNLHPWEGACNNGRKPDVDDDPEYPLCARVMVPSGLMLDGATMFSAAELLSLPQIGRYLLGRIVQDRTGLTGRYKMELEHRFPRPGEPTNPPDISQPSLFTAIREQWGLRLEPVRGPFKRIVIDDAQRPSEN